MKQIRLLKVAVFLACLLPLALLARKAFSDLGNVYSSFSFFVSPSASLGANPLEVITRSTGRWALIFIMITLAITPVRRIAGMPSLIRFRRMVGLFAFFYGCLHFLTYLWFDKSFDWAEIVKDLPKRPFITAGFTAFILMAPLAVTSTQGWIRRMGGKRWQALHKLVYISGIAGVVHFWWLVKADVREPFIFVAVLAVLLGYRIFNATARKKTQSRPASQPRGVIVPE